MKERRNKKIISIIICFVLVFLFCAAGTFAAIRMIEPENPLLEQPGVVSSSGMTETITLERPDTNTNLANPLTAENEKKQEESFDNNSEDNKNTDNTNKQDVAQNSGSKKDSQQSEKENKPILPEQGDFSENFEEEYTQLREDAFVQQTYSVSDLMREIGIDEPEQIIYVKNITDIDGDSLLQSINGMYSVYLSTTGTTILQIKYQDAQGNVQTYVKKIDYIRPEGSTPVEKQPLIQTNIKEEGMYNQPTLNFDVWVTDYRGKPLSYSDMEVKVNGEAADYIGEMDRQTYSTQLRLGSNQITIKITDAYQYTVTKSYTVYYKSGKGTITISLEAGTIGLKYLVEPKKIDVESGVSLAHVLDEYLQAEGFEYSYTGNLDDGFYLAKIQKKNLIKGFSIPKDLIQCIEKDELMFQPDGYESLDTLGEFDFCQGSGWMYSINGLYSSYGFNKAYVQDGDVVRIRFTLAYGKDINGYESVGMQYGKLKDYGKEW